MEWIYTEAKMSGQVSLELAQENKEKGILTKLMVKFQTSGYNCLMNDLGLDML
jgi:hypothetical protein